MFFPEDNRNQLMPGTMNNRTRTQHGDYYMRNDPEPLEFSIHGNFPEYSISMRDLALHRRIWKISFGIRIGHLNIRNKMSHLFI